MARPVAGHRRDGLREDPTRPGPCPDRHPPARYGRPRKTGGRTGMSTDIAAIPPPVGSMLRTLAPALRNFEVRLRTWLDAPHPQPLKPLVRATLQGVTADLRRKAE